MCGQMIKAMYGTRDRAQSWENEYMRFMTEMGFSPGMSTPGVSVNRQRGVLAVERVGAAQEVEAVCSGRRSV